MDKVYLFFLTFFYIGKIKYAPGTIASLITAFLWFNFTPLESIFQISTISLLLILGLFLCYQYSLIDSTSDDPGFIVIDEVIGMSIALFMVPKTFLIYLIAFIIFRILDITKPLFISASEKVKKGVGIVLDDVLSGLVTIRKYFNPRILLILSHFLFG